MSSNIMLKTTFSKPEPQPMLSLNMRNINQLFPGFTLGDFALLRGPPAVTTLATLLCVRAQLPPQLGGLGSNVVFIDGANTFRLYQITRLARLHQLDPKQVLDHIRISRAFTAYQMVSLILQKLEDAVTKCSAKLVIVSDIAAMFLDKDVQEEEAKRIYSQITTRLSKFAKEHQAIIVTTYPPHEDSKRNLHLHALTSARANVVIGLRQTRYEREFILEKHPTLTLGSAELPAEILPLTAFMEA
jgi:hypothetical protein